MAPSKMRAQTHAIVAEPSAGLYWLGGGLTALALLGLAGQAGAEEKIITSHGYNFFGELEYGADFDHLRYVNPEAPKGGEISIWTLGTFDSFNLYTRKGNAGALSNIGHEDVLTSYADDPTGVYCLLCTTMEYPETIDWVTFNLRDDVTMADGTPWTGHDLKFTFDMFMTDGLPSFRAAFGAFVEEVEVLDTYKVKFHFAPDSPERDRIGLAGGMPAFSQKWIEENGYKIDEANVTPIMGSGPYQLDSYDIPSRIIYKRNPDYWGNDLAANKGRNNFDSIRVEYFGDSVAAFEAFKAGAYTFRSENSSKTWATGYNFPGVVNGYVKPEKLPDGSLSLMQSYVFNLRRDIFQDRRVREAVGLMFNFEWSNESLFYGLYSRVTSFWGNSDLQATGVPSEGELALLQPLVDQGLLEASILTDEVVMPPVSGSRQLDRKNLRKASKLLDEAGWIVGDDGMRRKDGQVLTIEFLDSSPAFDRITLPYVENLKRLGIDASLNRVDPAQASEREHNYDFDMTTHNGRMSLEPSTGLKQWFGSEGVNESSRNLMGVADPAVDALIEEVVAATSKAELKTAVHALDRVLRAKLFWVPQWFKSEHTVAYYDMYEYPTPLPAYARGELDFWWYNAEKHEALKAAGALR
ncbi:MAG: extracellular solute-binding protein [Pseudomonadota bacterium]|nr:extracellular solute-binding protein [Pseudomonadota bacterium]